MRIGYARVSTKEQNLDLQIDGLTKAGCEKIYTEKASGVKGERTELDALLEHLREGDILVVWKLDRLGRSLSRLVELVEGLSKKQVGFQSLNDQIDTSGPNGRFMFHVIAAFAQLECDLISERTKAGLEAARARGRKGGRPKGLSQEAQDKAIVAKALYGKKELPAYKIAERLGISKTTFYKYLRIN